MTKRLFVLLAAFAAIAAITAGSALATVSYNNQYVGSVGIGDVQNALGYHNDAAFQADAAAGKISFSLASDQTQVFANGVECAPLTASGLFDTSGLHTMAPVYVGSFYTPKTPNVTVLKNNAGKVTGYTLNGVTSGAMVSGPMDFNVGTYCPSGEHFYGWVDPANVFSNQSVAGSPILQVSNGTTTASLPNTPVTP